MLAPLRQFFCIAKTIASMSLPQPTRKTAPATERGRSRTRPPSLPERTIHPPSAVRPVIMPTW
jgi:hypothetical protein